MNQKEWEVYEKAMEPMRKHKETQKKEKPSGGQPTELFKKLIGS